MAANFPGPYEIDMGIQVTISGLPLVHRFRVNCAVVGAPTPGTAFSAINVQNIGGSTTPLDTAVGALWGWMRPHYHTGVSVTDVQLWKYATGTYAKTFVSALATSLPAGSNVTAPTDSHQLTLSFRSANSGIMKLTLLEDSNTGKNRGVLIANAAGNNLQKLAAYIISTAGWVLARDDGFPIGTTFFTEGENEATFKNRHR